MKKFVIINNNVWEIYKPEDIWAELEKSEKAGCHVSDWAWQHAKYIGKHVESGKEFWLPYNYKQCICNDIKI